MTKKKILSINSFYYPTVLGGSELSEKALAEALSERYDVTILTTAEKETTLVKEIINGVNVIRIPAQSVYWSGDEREHSSFQKLQKKFSEIYSKKPFKMVIPIIEEINPDVILMGSICMGFGTAIFELARKYRVIEILHDDQVINPTWNKKFNSLVRGVNKRRSQLISEIITVSDAMGKIYRKASFFPNATFTTIENSVDAIGHTNKTIKVKNKPLKVGFFGILAAHKGVKEFLEAVALCDNEVEEVVLMGEDKERFSEKFHNPKVNFLGKKSIDEVYQKMSEVDVVVMPSIFEEPFGRVIIEAYRQRAIVITSNHGALPTLNIDSELILDEVSAQAISEKIKLIYKSEYGLERYEIYSKKYQHNIEKYIEVIERV